MDDRSQAAAVSAPDGAEMTAAAYIVRWPDGLTPRDRLEAHNVGPVGAFSRELLAQADGERLIYDGETITLDVDNGRWVWKVTGQNADGSVIYGRWPD